MRDLPQPCPCPNLLPLFSSSLSERKFKLLGFHGPNTKAVLHRSEGCESPWLQKMRSRREEGRWPTGTSEQVPGAAPGLGGWYLGAGSSLLDSAKGAHSEYWKGPSSPTPGAEDRGAEAGGKGDLGHEPENARTLGKSGPGGSCPSRPKNRRNHSRLSDIWGDSSQGLAVRMDSEKETNCVPRWPRSDQWVRREKGPEVKDPGPLPRAS